MIVYVPIYIYFEWKSSQLIYYTQFIYLSFRNYFAIYLSSDRYYNNDGFIMSG